MQVTIVTLGTRGDVQPFVHLAMSFREAGHAVRLCTHASFSELSSNTGIEFAPFGHTDPRVSQKADYESRPRTKVGVLWKILRRRITPNWIELTQLEDLIAGSDLVICNHLADWTYHLTEKFGIECVFAYLHPTHPTRSFPTTLMPQDLRAGSAFNLLTHRGLRHLYWLKNRSWINEWRTKRLGLPAISLLGPFREQYKKRIPYIFGFSAALVPPIRDWPAWYRMTGYWFHPRPIPATIPPDLESFLACGDSPVVIAFGSVTSPALHAVLEKTIRSIRAQAGRAVVVTGWGEHSLTEQNDLFITQTADYSWLFRRAAVVIHAGGSGTVAEITRAGVPSISVPFAAEQRFWSDCLWRLGVATRPIRPSELSPAAISAALAEIRLNQGIRDRARQLAQEMARERGAAEAVDFLCGRRLQDAETAAVVSLGVETR